MATSKYKTSQHPSTAFVESAGGILFNPVERRICILHYHRNNEHLLPKGRRNVGESRAAAAVREVREETGVPCRLMHVNMQSRAPSAAEDAAAGPGAFVPDVARKHEKVEGEPFMVTYRQLGGAKGVKIIWWFVMEVDGTGIPDGGEAQFTVDWVGYHEACGKLTYQLDRDVMQRAIDIVEGREM